MQLLVISSIILASTTSNVDALDIDGEWTLTLDQIAFDVLIDGERSKNYLYFEHCGGGSSQGLSLLYCRMVHVVFSEAGERSLMPYVYSGGATFKDARIRRDRFEFSIDLWKLPFFPGDWAMDETTLKVFGFKKKGNWVVKGNSISRDTRGKTNHEISIQMMPKESSRARRLVVKNPELKIGR